MKKMLFAAIIAVSLAIPQLYAQEAESENENNPEETSEEAQPKGKADKKAPNPDAPAAKGKQTATPPASGKNVFSRQQQRIQAVMNKLKKAKKNSEKKRYSEELRSEQNKLRSLYAKHVNPVKDEIPRLHEQIRLCRPENKAELEKKLAAQEEKVKGLEAAAALEKWCEEVKDNPAGGDKKAPDPGSHIKRRKNRSKKKKL